MRGFYADREQVLRDGIAHLRAAWAAHPEDRELSDLIAEFVTQDEDFARLWSEREVSVNGRGRNCGIRTQGPSPSASKSCYRSRTRDCACSSTAPRTR